MNSSVPNLKLEEIECLALRKDLGIKQVLLTFVHCSIYSLSYSQHSLVFEDLSYSFVLINAMYFPTSILTQRRLRHPWQTT